MMFKIMKKHQINKHFLDDFVRDQVTTRVKCMNQGSLHEIKSEFTDVWDQPKKERISNWFKEVVNENKGTVIGVFDRQKLIGFSCTILPIFNDYIDLQYIHLSKDYRGQGIGKELFYITALEAKKYGAKKLYISAHPAIETQGFYMQSGCKQAEYINEEILAEEPYDIQLEFRLDYPDIFLRYAKHLMKKDYVSSKESGKIATRLFRKLPENEYEFLAVCKQFMNQHNISLFSIATNWFKKRHEVIKMSNFKYFEDLLYNYISGWGEVDQFCYRALNRLVELEDENFEYLLKWSDSKNKDVRRASLVSMIRSSGKLTLEYDYDKMITLVEKLKNDEDFHVRKAVGWVLKCAYPTYPLQVETYLTKHVKTLDRMIFRYALEHAKSDVKNRLMSLE